MKKFYKKTAFFTALVVISLVFSGCSASNFFTGRNADEYIYSGTAEADEYNITAEAGGRIAEVKIKEGQAVNEGEIVASLDSSEGSIKHEQAKTNLENAQNELEKVLEGSRSEDIEAQRALVAQAQAVTEQVRDTLKQAQNNSNIAKTNYDYKVKLYDEEKALFDSGFGTKSSVDAAENAVKNAQAALSNAKLSESNARAQLDSSMAQLEASKQKLNLLVNGATDKTRKTAQLGVDTASESLELSSIGLGKTTIKANISGVIETINFKKGEYVSPGNAIATIIDTKNMYVKVYVPERMLPSLKLQKEVTMKSDFTGDKIIKGRIDYISTEAEFTPMNIVTKKDRTKLVYAVKIQVLDNADEIKPGMLLDVNLK
jgi:HlyD family secretion protein